MNQMGREVCTFLDIHVFAYHIIVIAVHTVTEVVWRPTEDSP